MRPPLQLRPPGGLIPAPEVADFYAAYWPDFAPSLTYGVVIDWKSDVDPPPSAQAHYRRQLGDYRKQTQAKRALLVFMTSGKVIDVA